MFAYFLMFINLHERNSSDMYDICCNESLKRKSRHFSCYGCVYARSNCGARSILTSRGAHNIQSSQDIQKCFHVSGAPVVLGNLYVSQYWKMLRAVGMTRIVPMTNTIDTLRLLEILNMLGAHRYPCIVLEIHGCRCV